MPSNRSDDSSSAGHAHGPGIELTREALYEAVWTEPIYRLAPKYGLSDVGLAKACRRLGVPVPPRGYWAKLRHGKRVDKPILPPASDGQDTLLRLAADQAPADGKSEERAARLREVRAALESAPVRPHPLAVEARQLAEAKKKPDDRSVSHGRAVPRVLSARLPRATRVASKLLHALEGLGCSVAVASDPGWYWLAFRIERLGQKCWIAIEEECDVVELKTDVWPRHKVVPTGRLSVRLRQYQNRVTRTKWSDTERRPLDEILFRIIGSILRLTDAEHARSLERAEWHRQYEEERRIRAEKEQRRRAEQERRAQLEADAEAWQKAQRIRAYVDAVEKAGRAEHLPDWTQWARHHADRLDPTLRQLRAERSDLSEDDYD